MSDLLSDYDYALPEELIAQHPAEPRDSSRLLVIHRDPGRRDSERFEHRRFRDLPEYVAGDLLVANNTRVFRARLLGRRVGQAAAGSRGVDGQVGGKVEFVLLEELAPRVWEGLFHASAKYRPGLEFEVPTPDGRGLRGRLVKGSAESPSGNVVAEFDRDPVESGAGEVPLPKYIRRGGAGASAGGSPGVSMQAADAENYQTVYAKEPGSAAAPTAGLHFTPAVLEELSSRGTGWEEITLHVGVGTFRPVKSENIAAHVMHEERYEIAPETASRVTDAKHRGKRVVAVGTTTVRTLESAWKEGALQAGPMRTGIFIRPGFRFQVVDRLITNFHLPKSTLLMLVSAFAGRELVLRAYEEAVREKYRFFSYGDSMLIL